MMIENLKRLSSMVFTGEIFGVQVGLKKEKFT